MIAITVTMGLGLYGFANSQTNTATKSFATEATDYINYKADRFVIAGLDFKTNDDSNQFTAYVFNSGERTTEISTAVLTDGTTSAVSTFCPTDGAVQPKSLQAVVFTAC